MKIPKEDLIKFSMKQVNRTYIQATKDILDHIIDIQPNMATLIKLRKELDKKYER